jgi:putative thioredoxin
MSNTYDITDFHKEVIEPSYKKPVLVDFWAEWCQPCKTLGPVLEKVAEDYADKLTFAKLNTDKLPKIASENKIKGIPAVKLFINGAATAEFTGAIPKSKIIKFLNEHLPDENKNELEVIKNNIKYGVNPKVISQLENLVIKAPEIIEAKVLLAQLTVINSPENASKLVSGIMENSPFFLSSFSVKSYSEFILMDEVHLEESPVKNLILIAHQALKDKNFELALDNLINSVVINKAYMDELARKVCVAIFNILGDESEISKKYRRRFNMSLY